MSKLASAAAGFVTGVMSYYFVRDRVWGRAEGVAAQLQEMQANVPAMARRPVTVGSAWAALWPRACGAL